MKSIKRIFLLFALLFIVGCGTESKPRGNIYGKIVDENDSILAGRTVSVYKGESESNCVLTASTTADSTFLFTNLEEGYYMVSECRVNGPIDYSPQPVQVVGGKTIQVICEIIYNQSYFWSVSYPY